MIEVRAADLRFTFDEAKIFLQEVMGLALSPEEILALESRTEGWIVGLQLAALALQGQKNASDFISTFTGSHRYIVDYLVDEVFSLQPPDIQAFLLHTSVLDQLNGSLCNAVTDREDGYMLLEQLEHANLFLTLLDDMRQWYRYHSLFAEMLCARLRQEQPEQIP